MNELVWPVLLIMLLAAAYMLRTLSTSLFNYSLHRASPTTPSNTVEFLPVDQDLSLDPNVIPIAAAIILLLAFVAMMG